MWVEEEGSVGERRCFCFGGAFCWGGDGTGMEEETEGEIVLVPAGYDS